MLQTGWLVLPVFGQTAQLMPCLSNENTDGVVNSSEFVGSHSFGIEIYSFERYICKLIPEFKLLLTLTLVTCVCYSDFNPAFFRFVVTGS